MSSEKHLHFVGIGGIGMSGLAAMCAGAGFCVTGSDRGASRPENRRILDALERQGIKIYPQDGSFIADGKPEALVYSTAIEEDNPDFTAGQGIGRLHRSQLLARMISETGAAANIAVCGSCGKSSVTAYTAEALANLGENPGCLNGALMKRFIAPEYAGNFHPGDGKYFVFEADESDKSLVNYHPEYAIVLNIGTDHYGKEELAELFGTFLRNVRKGAVLERQVYEAVRKYLPPELKIRIFDDRKQPDSTHYLSGFSVKNGQALAEFNGIRQLKLPQTGRHTALNALAIEALLELLGFPPEKAFPALEKFHGVWRRSDFAGVTAAGAKVFDDYAHNPEKIASCIEAMRESSASGRVFAVFQPHGFKPFGFMREELFRELETVLKCGDRFLLLPPYYAGGTSCFSPSSEEVTADYRQHSSHPESYLFFPDREQLSSYLQRESSAGDVIVTMGARDNSLSDYAKSLTK